MLPMGDFTCMRSLPQMYEQCKAEDPDINAADFVFDHLLNLEDVTSYFENEADEHERPHQPYQQIQVIQLLIAIHDTPVQEQANPVFIFPAETVYSLYMDRDLPSVRPSEIFHPPAV